MGEVKFSDLQKDGKGSYDNTVNAERGFHGEYFLVVEKNGAMHCSCGLPLERKAHGEYACSAGWPIYRPGSGEVLKDKFGNLMLKIMPHANADVQAQAKYKAQMDKKNGY